jgi:hypothetical protein
MTTGVELGEKLQDLLAPHLFTKHGFAAPILTVKMKRMFAQLDSYQCHVLHDGLSGKKHPTA